jgi:hypothetical protein
MRWSRGTRCKKLAILYPWDIYRRERLTTPVIFAHFVYFEAQHLLRVILFHKHIYKIPSHHKSVYIKIWSHRCLVTFRMHWKITPCRSNWSATAKNDGKKSHAACWPLCGCFDLLFMHITLPIEVLHPWSLEVPQQDRDYIRGRQSEFDVLPRTQTPDHLRKNGAVCSILTCFSWSKMWDQSKRQIADNLSTQLGPRTTVSNDMHQFSLGVRDLGGV